MYIEYVSPSPKAGIKEHVSREVAAAIVAAGLAKEVNLTPEERLALRFGNYGKPPAAAPTPTWNCIRSPYTGAPLIQRRCGDETTCFNASPSKKQWPDCPPEVIKKFEQMAEQDWLTAQQNMEAYAANRHRGGPQ